MMKSYRHAFLVALACCLVITSGCDVSGSNNSNSQANTFARTLAITYQGDQVNAMPQAMAGDGEGGAVIAGYFQPPGRGTDMFVAHVDKEGTLLWQKSFGTPNPDKAYDIIRTKNNDFVVTGIKDRIRLYLLRMSAQGQVIWQHTYNRINEPATDSTSAHVSRDYGFAVTQTEDGGFAVAGKTDVSLTPIWYASAFNAPAILRVDAQGKRLWYNYYMNEKVGRGRALTIIQRPNQGFFVSGLYESSWPLRVTKEGTLREPVLKGPINGMDYESITKLKAGDYIMAGDGFNQDRITVTKISSNGKDEIWSNKYGFGTINAITETQNGDIVGAGSLVGENGHQTYFFKLDVNGNLLWKRTPKLKGNSSLFGVHQTKGGGVILAGVFKPTNTGGTPMIIRTDSLGHINHIASDLKRSSKN